MFSYLTNGNFGDVFVPDKNVFVIGLIGFDGERANFHRANYLKTRLL
jgi:hypothetical protein